jgi:hypothetical protein
MKGGETLDLFSFLLTLMKGGETLDIFNIPPRSYERREEGINPASVIYEVLLNSP